MYILLHFLLSLKLWKQTNGNGDIITRTSLPDWVLINHSYKWWKQHVQWITSVTDLVVFIAALVHLNSAFHTLQLCCPLFRVLLLQLISCRESRLLAVYTGSQMYLMEIVWCKAETLVWSLRVSYQKCRSCKRGQLWAIVTSHVSLLALFFTSYWWCIAKRKFASHCLNTSLHQCVSLDYLWCLETLWVLRTYMHRLVQFRGGDCYPLYFLKLLFADVSHRVQAGGCTQRVLYSPLTHCSAAAQQTVCEAKTYFVWKEWNKVLISDLWALWRRASLNFGGCTTLHIHMTQYTHVTHWVGAARKQLATSHQRRQEGIKQNKDNRRACIMFRLWKEKKCIYWLCMEASLCLLWFLPCRLPLTVFPAPSCDDFDSSLVGIPPEFHDPQDSQNINGL